jgi:hypothetical protein
MKQKDSKLGRAADTAKETLSRARDGVVSTAGQVKDRTVEAASAAARIVREAEPDHELKENVKDGTERALGRAGSAVSGAAPTIGRGTEYAVDKVGAALKFVARPLAIIIGTIAGTVGGWWKKAAERGSDLPITEEEACRVHFSALGLEPTGVTFERARPGYALGFVAATNPDYRGRNFEEIEEDLRLGFHDREDEYHALRDFARYGYERGLGSGHFLE